MVLVVVEREAALPNNTVALFVFEAVSAYTIANTAAGNHWCAKGL